MWGFPGVVVSFGGVYWDPPIYGNYQGSGRREYEGEGPTLASHEVPGAEAESFRHGV